MSMNDLEMVNVIDELNVTFLLVFVDDGVRNFATLL